MIEDIPEVSELTPGETYSRSSLHNKYGGNYNSGISPSGEYPYIFLFTGSAGEQYGYEDGFKGDKFIYTGEGQTGDMEMKRGNKAIRDHEENGKELHLFENNEEAWSVDYLGQFKCSDWFTEQLPDANGNEREAIRFELEPINNMENKTNPQLKIISPEAHWQKVKTRKEKAKKFLENPSYKTFNEFIEECSWTTSRFKDSETIFEENNSLTPEGLSDILQEASRTESIKKPLSVTGFGIATASEIMASVNPEKFIIFDKASDTGMEDLGYDLPNHGSSSPESYNEFIEAVNQAVEKYSLPDLVKDSPEWATDLQKAYLIFDQNYSGEIDISRHLNKEGDAKNRDEETDVDETDNEKTTFGDYKLDKSTSDGSDPNERTTFGDYKPELEVKDEDIELTHPGLFFSNWDRIKSRIEQALKNGNHLLLFGPPGTGKTKLARKICEQIVGKGNFELVTGSADWSTFDTIGGYQTTTQETLEFKPGVVLNRFQEDTTHKPVNEWLVIDEINRADIDKAFGSLFSALTGETVTLPFETPEQQNIQLLDHTQTTQEISKNKYYIPEDWRMIATINTLDKTSLYEMSYAFMRRWAFIPIGIPDLDEDPNELIEKYVEVWREQDEDLPDLNQHYDTVGKIWKAINEEREIGPAIVEDIYRHIAKGNPENPDFTSPIIMYIYPQLEGLRKNQLEKLIKTISNIDAVTNEEELWNVARDFFQQDLER